MNYQHWNDGNKIISTAPKLNDSKKTRFSSFGNFQRQWKILCLIEASVDFSKCKTETLLPCEKWASENTRSLITHTSKRSQRKVSTTSPSTKLSLSLYVIYWLLTTAFHHSYNVITMFIHFLYNENFSKMGHHQKNLLFFSSDLNQKPFFVL